MNIEVLLIGILIGVIVVAALCFNILMEIKGRAVARDELGYEDPYQDAWDGDPINIDKRIETL